MTEFAQGIINTVKNKMDESLALALIFFIGHILIAMTVVSIITGASTVSYTHLTLPTIYSV